MAITINHPPKISGTFKHWLRDYLKNSSVAGCAYYLTPKRPAKERYFWLAVHITSIICILFMIMEATIAYTSNATVTTVETDKYPVQEINFPGIAICNVNRISKKAAMKMAEDLHNRLNHVFFGNFTVQEIGDMLKYFGHLYLFEFNDSEKDKIDFLHKLLTLRSKKYPAEVSKKLIPDCLSILKHCVWSGNHMHCEDVFSDRKTGDGLCCTFNYVRLSDDFGTKNPLQYTRSASEVKRSDIVGSNYGLTVWLDDDFTDYFYKMHPIQGYKIMVFSPLDYPDISSGGLREVMIPFGMESSVTLRATTLYSNPDVSMYREDKRDCRFSNELSGIFGGSYSHSDCLMYCRIDDIIKHCNCIPFFYPNLSDQGNIRTCDLTDLRCLKKYRSRWWSVRPRSEKFGVPYVEDDIEDSLGILNCSECLPACSDVIYDVSANFAPLTIKRAYFDKILVDVEGYSLVHIFFKNTGVVKLRQDVMFYWYELMSNYGGICGFFLGISIIGIVEFVYFFTLRLYKQKTDKSEEERNFRFTFVKAARPSHRPLYWREMVHPNQKY